MRALAEERDAVILAHNYQLPELQDVADFVGDSLGLSRHAADTDAEVIEFCGVHFMAETASILCPDKKVLIADLGAGCSLSDSINADQLRAWKAEHPGAMVVMYVNTSAEVKAETDYCCTSGNAVQVVEHIWAEHGPDTEILFGPDMWLGAFVERETGLKDDPERRARFHIWDGECHVHAGIRPDDIKRRPRGASRRRVPDPPRVRLLDPGDGVRRLGRRRPRGRAHALDRRHARPRRRAPRRRATSSPPRTGCSTRCRRRRPEAKLIEANRMAFCKYMKMITLPEGARQPAGPEATRSRCPPEIAERAKLPIERMVAIG